MKTLVLLFISSFLLLSAPSILNADEGLHVVYRGELINAEARPLAGVFPFEYKLYDEESAETAIWSEQHFVAVFDGQYEITLGNTTALDPELSDREMFVAVVFQGSEILRERLVLRPAEDETETAPDPTEVMATGDVNVENVTEVTFAQLADRALVAQEAEHAADSDRLGGRTLDEIDQYDEILDRLTEHTANYELHGGSQQTGVSGSTTVLQRVGGDGGVRYTRMCPSGYVMVGLRGGAGQLIDSFEIICAPLE